MKHLRTYLILISILILASCNAQEKTAQEKEQPAQLTANSAEIDPYFVKTQTVTSKNGPSSITRNILQDRQGNIWLATWEGIMRYDGQTFTNFTNKDTLRRFHVFSTLEDSKGNLWFGSIGGGVFRYDGKAFVNYTTKEGLIYDRTLCFYEDNKGHIWIGTEKGISIFDGKIFTNITTKDGLTDNDVNVIIEDKNGVLWIGTRGAACTYDGKTFTQFHKPNLYPFINVRSIIKDKEDNIWLGGKDGLWRYDGQIFVNLSKNFVGYIYEDRKGNIWTSSQGKDGWNWALSRYDKKPLPYELPTATVILEEENMFFGIIEDTNGGIWLGSLKGVYRYDGAVFNRFQAEGKE